MIILMINVAKEKHFNKTSEKFDNPKLPTKCMILPIVSLLNC